MVFLNKKEKKARGPQYILSPMSTPMLNYAEYYMSFGQKCFYALAMFLIGGFVGLIFYGGLFKSEGEATIATYISNVVVFTIIGLISAKFFVPAINKMLLTKRDRALKRQFVDMLETMSTSLSAGNTLYGATENAKEDLLNQYSEDDMIIVELDEVLSGVTNGMNIEEMFNSFGKRSCNEDIMNFCNVINNCYRLGGNFAEVIRHTRDIISDKFAIADEIETKLSSNKLQHNAMSVMPVALIALLKMVNSDFARNLASLLGVAVTTISIIIFVAAYFWGRKIIDIR